MDDKNSTNPLVPQVVTVPYSGDHRGTFVKPFHEGLFFGGSLSISELYWTRSSRGTIRGLHFQLPPSNVNKLVWVSRGSIVDVVVDLRTGPSYGTVLSAQLDDRTGTAMWIPSGFAHGFQALEDDSVANYATDAGYVPELDTGVRWDSIDFDWPLPAGPISARDESFVAIADFASPFRADA